jgi:hypothetical protein
LHRENDLHPDLFLDVLHATDVRKGEFGFLHLEFGRPRKASDRQALPPFAITFGFPIRPGILAGGAEL